MGRHTKLTCLLCAAISFLSFPLRAFAECSLTSVSVRSAFRVEGDSRTFVATAGAILDVREGAVWNVHPESRLVHTFVLPGGGTEAQATAHIEAVEMIGRRSLFVAGPGTLEVAGQGSLPVLMSYIIKDKRRKRRSGGSVEVFLMLTDGSVIYHQPMKRLRRDSFASITKLRGSCLASPEVPAT